MTRRALREHCFKVLFCTDFYPAAEADEQIDMYLDQPEEDDTDETGNTEIIHEVELKEDEQKELKARADDIIAKIPEIDEKIAAATEGWKLKRIGKVELTILRLAVYEMKYDENVPEKVAINEAVEIAKKFGQDESPAFINGVLAKLVD
ncbi:MAG: transcription antitermination factor NusB [Lachnospiraceae bacterium]|nr:transcription antitermination factor NusB [Lachnospiraceae bacterium]